MDGRMVLEGEGVDAAGKSLRHRITWTPLPDGRVRQHWASRGASGPWGMASDGTSTRKSAQGGLAGAEQTASRRGALQRASRRSCVYRRRGRPSRKPLVVGRARRA